MVEPVQYVFIVLWFFSNFSCASQMYVETFERLLHSKSNSDKLNKFLSLILRCFFFRANRLAMQRTSRSGIT